MADHETKRPKGAFDHRLRRMRDQGLKPGTTPEGEALPPKSIVECGWGRLIFANSFEDPEVLVETIRDERPDRRDIAFYVKDPHVLLAAAPQELFLDPSHTYRLDLSTYRPARNRRKGFTIRRISSRSDAEAINVLYASRNMVAVPLDYFWSDMDPRTTTVLVAEEDETGEIVGTVTGINHARAIGDPANGSSLWCLAVSPNASHPGIGEALVRRLAEQYKGRGAAYLDLSVIHDNETAISLYEKLGFERIHYFTVKHKNPINEALFAGPSVEEKLNPYAAIIVDEARRRGIHTEITDEEGGYFKLSYGGRSVHCREALSEFTSGVAVSICDDKAVTRRMINAAGLYTPDQILADDKDRVQTFLDEYGSVVVKPAHGEQGRGVAIGLDEIDETMSAIDYARQFSEDVLVEQFVQGQDLRLVVIDYRVVATAIRKPAQITGDGQNTVRELIRIQTRRREAATDGESRIPVDHETERCLADKGFTLDDIPEVGRDIPVRKTANLHSGGTIHDVTAETHPELIEAAVTAARAIEIPVTGIDLIVKDPGQPEYWFIEANERPGLANHEPQPTVERFVDFLFPLSIPQIERPEQRRDV